VAEDITLYELLGGEPAVHALVDRFYDLMDALPEAAPLRAMHPVELSRSRQRLFEFLSGWLGGPGLYMERHGHPRLRSRHTPFPIDQAATDQWMLCMRQALVEQIPDDGLRLTLEGAFRHLAGHMRNLPE